MTARDREHQALRAFAVACLEHYEELVAAVLRATSDQPALGQVLRAVSAGEWDGRAVRLKVSLRRAVDEQTAGSELLSEIAGSLAELPLTAEAFTDLATDVVLPLLASHMQSRGAASAVADLLRHNRCLARLLLAIAAARSRTFESSEPARPAVREAAEARYSRLVRSGIIGVVVVDPQLNVIEVNDALLEIIGYSRAEAMTGRFRFTDVTPPEWRRSDDLAVEQLNTYGVSALREKEYVHKDGRRIPVLVGAARLDAAAPEVISFVLDISERKRSDGLIRKLAQERAADAKFRALVESAPDAAVIIDAAGRIVLVNVRTESMFGHHREALLGQSADLLLAQGSRRSVGGRSSFFGDPLTTGTPRMMWGQRRDGSAFPIEVSSSPLNTSEGLLVSSTIRDITERRRVEAALEASAAQLKMTNRELESFSYSMAHDLRAPLRGMSGFAQILLDEYNQKLDDEGKECLQEIQANAKRMGAHIDALLSLARVSRGELQLLRVDLTALVENVAAQLAAAEPSRHVELAVESDLFANMDPSLARTLVESLLDNARKFTMNVEAPRVEFGRTIKDGRATFFVRDNGAGFDMEYASKLFTPFQRLHSVREFPGTGIGLASVQRIIHRHGGCVSAEGSAGRGATISFSLPEDLTVR